MNRDALLSRLFLGALALAVLIIAGAIAAALWSARPQLTDALNPGEVELGQQLYVRHCAVCHGANLEGQPNWRERLPNGRLPAPPHDASGHTWHHPDDVLIGITREGLVPGRYAPLGYESAMPAFGNVLTDAQIRAILAFIKSTWSSEIRAAQAEVNRKSSVQNSGSRHR